MSMFVNTAVSVVPASSQPVHHKRVAADVRAAQQQQGLPEAHPRSTAGSIVYLDSYFRSAEGQARQRNQCREHRRQLPQRANIRYQPGRLASSRLSPADHGPAVSRHSVASTQRLQGCQAWCGSSTARFLCCSATRCARVTLAEGRSCIVLPPQFQTANAHIPAAWHHRHPL